MSTSTKRAGAAYRILLVVAAILISILATMASPTFASGDEQKSVLYTTSSTADSTCALLRADGYLWRCTSSGAPVAKQWAVGSNSLWRWDYKLTTLYIDSNVKNVNETFLVNRKIEGSANAADEKESRYALGSVTRIVFLLDKNKKSSVQQIGEDAFRYLSALVTVENFDKTAVKIIGNQAFNDCSKLKTISLPSTVESIGDDAFAYCKSLTRVNGLLN